MLKKYNTLDDRREITRLLETLPPSRRLAFLQHCCRIATLPNSPHRPFVLRETIDLTARARWDSQADAQLTTSIYFDLWMLATQYQFDLDRAVMELEAWGRGREREQGRG